MARQKFVHFVPRPKPKKSPQAQITKKLKTNLKKDKRNKQDIKDKDAGEFKKY